MTPDQRINYLQLSLKELAEENEELKKELAYFQYQNGQILEIFMKAVFETAAGLEGVEDVFGPGVLGYTRETRHDH